MRYVYLLESEALASKRYVGMTSDLKRRMSEHNRGNSPHTAKHAPWKLVTYVAFSDERKAEIFERYLKSGSGHAFARRRFW
jgi:putative endonuclease